MDKYSNDMIMVKLCDVCVKLTDIHKDIKCIKEQIESKCSHLHKDDHWSSTCEIKHTDKVISVKG